MSAGQQPERVMLNSLTSLRFIAAFFVFLWHSRLWTSTLSRYELGYAGVSFFFILSGFILTYVYFDKLKNGNLKNIKSFYIARIAKIYPVHILTLLFALPLIIHSFNTLFPDNTKLIFVGQFITNTLLLQSYVPDNRVNFSFNGVSWSISNEFFFYALMPLIVLLLMKFHHKLTTRRLLDCLAVLWLSMVVITSLRTAPLDDWLYYIFPLMRLPDFVAGICIGLIYLRLSPVAATRSWFKKNATALEIYSVMLLIAAMLLSAYIPQSYRFSVLLMPFWSFLIFSFAWQSGALSQKLSKRPLIFLGEISFSFYMLHKLVLYYLFALNVPFAAFLGFGLTLVLSAAVYMFYEEPMRKLLRAYLEKKGYLETAAGCTPTTAGFS